MKKTITLIIILCFALLSQAQVIKTANVTTAGTLSSVASSYLSTVTNLTITGTIDARDFKTMRDNMPALAILDISNVTIAAYSGTAGTAFSYNINYLANKIPMLAFYNNDTSVENTSLTSISLPNNIASLYGGDFIHCKKLIEILVGSSNTYFATLDGVLFNKSKTILIAFPKGKQGSYTIPSSVTTIQSEAFSGSKEITSVSIPNSVTTIEGFAFSYCTGLISLTIPSSIVSIGNSAFVDCSNLSSIYSNLTVPVSLTSSTNVFSGVNKTNCMLYVPFGSKNNYLTSPQWQDFTKITDGTPIVTTTLATNITNSTASAGGNITDIGTTPIVNSGVCWSTSINPTIINNKTTDGSGTGSFTSSITGLSIGTVYHFRAYATNSLGTSYGADLMFATPKTINVGTAGTLSTLLTTDEKIAISNLTITGTIDASDLKFIRDNMLSLTTLDLSSVTIAAYTGSFGTYGYGVYLANEIPKNSFGGYLYPTQRAPIKSITLPISVINIADYAFYNCYDLNSIVIPNGVTSIGNYAFLGCGILNNITLPNSVTNIGNNAFYNCSGLSNFTMSNSVTSIGNSAFYLCTGLLSIILPNTVTSIGSSAFYNCTSLASIYTKSIVPLNLTSSNNVFFNVNKATCILHVPVGSIGAYVTSNQWGLFTNIIDDAPILTTTTASNITSTTAMGGGNITLAGNSDVTDRGVCWSTTAKPTITNSKTSNGTGIGAFTSSITGLSPAVTYHIRAYATNNVGTSYGSDLTFTTLGTAPTIITTTASSITTATATAGGNITDAGTSTVTVRGVCWSTTANPTIANSKTTDGSGVGVFSSSITGLTSGITYHIRAYATSSVGTSYGSDITFTTLGTAPTVTTNTVTNITNATVKTGGNVTSSGTSTVTARGVCWGTTTNPTITNNNKTIDGSGIGTFTSTINGLTPATTYHIRAYATNIDGTAYGSDLSFTTSAIVPASFSLSAPANGGWITSTPLFQWATSIGAFSYNLYIDDVLKKENITTTSYQLLPTEALSSGMHTWHVVAGDGYAVQSNETWSFRVDGTQPTAFSLLTPTDNSWTANPRPTLTWGASSDVNSGLAKYQLWVNGVLNRDNISTTATSITPSNSLSNGSHTWEIKAVDNVGNVRSSTQIFTTKVDNLPPSNLGRNCLSFDGINDEVNVKYNSIYNFTNIISIEAWVFINNYVDGANIIDKGSAFELRQYGGKLNFALNNSDVVGGSFSNGIIPLNTWTHVAVTYQSGIVKYYINGSLDKTDNIASQTITNNQTQITIGKNTEAGSIMGNVYYWWNGKISNVRIWNIIRSESDISNDKDRNLACESGLVGDWDFNEGTGNIAFDKSIYQNYGIISGAIYQNLPVCLSLCNLKMPLGNQYISSNTPTFSWGKTFDSGIGFQKFQLFVDCNMVKDNLSDSTWTVTAPLAYGAHTWHVKGFDLLGNNQSSYSRTFYIDNARPNAFNLTSPTNNQIVNLPTPNLTWQATTDSTGGSGLRKYQLLINGIVNRDSIPIAQTTVAPKNALAQGSYNWTVKVYDNVGNVRQSTQTNTFYVDWENPTDFTLINPIDNSTLTVAKPEFKWHKSSDVGSGISKYELNISGQTPITILPSDTSKLITTNLSNGPYTWYVKAYDVAGGFTSSNTQTFTINTSVSGVEQTEMNSSIKVYPNPVGNELVIESAKNERTNFEIINSIGQVIYKGILFDKISVQIGSFNSGIYVIKLGNEKTAYEFKKILKK